MLEALILIFTLCPTTFYPMLRKIFLITGILSVTLVSVGCIGADETPVPKPEGYPTLLPLVEVSPTEIFVSKYPLSTPTPTPEPTKVPKPEATKVPKPEVVDGPNPTPKPTPLSVLTAVPTPTSRPISTPVPTKIPGWTQIQLDYKDKLIPYDQAVELAVDAGISRPHARIALSQIRMP
jgi:hypothetical protein